MPKHETKTDWDGPNIYRDIWRDGNHIGREWVGGEHEEYDESAGELADFRTEITEEEARDIMGDDAYDRAVSAGECVRFD